MIRVCCECKKVFGEKEPLEDRSETHGICEKCSPKVTKRFKKELKKYRKIILKEGRNKMPLIYKILFWIISILIAIEVGYQIGIH
jgi:hypothetical protein